MCPINTLKMVIPLKAHLFGTKLALTHCVRGLFLTRHTILKTPPWGAMLEKTSRCGKRRINTGKGTAL